MKALVVSSSVDGGGASPKMSTSWCFRTGGPSRKQQFLERAMKKKSRRLSELCCVGASSALTSGVDSSELERPMIVSSTSSSASSNCSAASVESSCSSSASVQQEWIDVNEMQSVSRKRVMVVVDDSREARTALLWALSHVVHKKDVVTLLYVFHSSSSQLYDHQDSRAVVSERARLRSEEKGSELISGLKSLCALRQPEADVEVVMVAGEKGPAIVRQAKKLDSSILVLGQKKLNFLQREEERIMRGIAIMALKCLRWSLNKEDKLVEYCIHHSDCLTLSVRRKSKQCGGYLINSKWQKNFWLLA